eukprot:1185755-Prorocentrum_minimum.AAC.1
MQTACGTLGARFYQGRPLRSQQSGQMRVHRRALPVTNNGGSEKSRYETNEREFPQFKHLRLKKREQ